MAFSFTASPPAALTRYSPPRSGRSANVIVPSSDQYADDDPAFLDPRDRHDGSAAEVDALVLAVACFVEADRLAVRRPEEPVGAFRSGQHVLLRRVERLPPDEPGVPFRAGDEGDLASVARDGQHSVAGVQLCAWRRGDREFDRLQDGGRSPAGRKSPACKCREGRDAKDRGSGEQDPAAASRGRWSQADLALEDPAQLEHHVARRLPALVRILRQRAPDDVVEGGRASPDSADAVAEMRGGSAVRIAAETLAGLVPVECLASRQHLVERDAEAKDVGPRRRSGRPSSCSGDM